MLFQIDRSKDTVNKTIIFQALGWVSKVRNMLQFFVFYSWFYCSIFYSELQCLMLILEGFLELIAVEQDMNNCVNDGNDNLVVRGFKHAR